MLLKLEDLEKLPNVVLPGEKAHGAMSPKMRDPANKVRKSNVDFRESAVLIVLYQNNGEIFIPLIKRNIYDGTHSGQISFPGGKKEIEDPDLKYTALRETQEEIGLKNEQLSIIHQLSDIYIPPSNFMVSSFVALHHDTPKFILDKNEVADIIHFPLRSLMNDEIIESKRIYVEKYQAHLKVPAYVFNEEVIWGATAIILAELKYMINELIS